MTEMFRCDAWAAEIRDADLPPSAKLVAFVLATLNRDRSDPYVDPGMSLIVESTGRCQRTVSRNLTLLKRQGWLTEVRHGGGPDRLNSIYQMIRPQRTESN